MTKRTQLTRGQKRRVMYVENKNGQIDGVRARIGWVTFSKTGQSVHYRERTLARANGVRGNFIDVESGHEYWISGIKKRGSNVHWAESASVEIDEDALEEYRRLKAPSTRAGLQDPKSPAKAAK